MPCGGVRGRAENRPRGKGGQICIVILKDLCKSFHNPILCPPRDALVYGCQSAVILPQTSRDKVFPLSHPGFGGHERCDA